MHGTSSGTHRFRYFTPADTSRVWTRRLTDGDQTRRYLHGLIAQSSWCAGCAHPVRASPEVDGRSLLMGTVLCAQPRRLLSLFPAVRTG